MIGFNYTALRAMCKYYTLLTPSPSGESPTIWWPYWYRSSVTEPLTFPMWTSPSEYGARAGHILVGPPSGLWGGGVTVELAVADSWFIGVITDNSESSLVDSTNHCFRWLRRSLVLAISCRCFPTQEALLWAILARACTAYSSSLAMWVRVTPACGIQSGWNCTACYCGVLVAHWCWLMRPIGWPHWTAA